MNPGFALLCEISENALQDIDFDDNSYCARLQEDDDLKDNRCRADYGTLCQYDCDNPPSVTSNKHDAKTCSVCFSYHCIIFVVACTDECPSASTSADYILNGNYYTSVRSSDYDKYERAMENCRSQGGALPTIQTEQDYLDAKVIAGSFPIIAIT